MSDQSTDISFVGQINVTKAEIISMTGAVIDISHMIADLSIYEDIFSNTMSGYALIEDSIDLINTLPLVGQELFNVELQTPTLQNKIVKTFYIYKLQNRKSKKRSQVYMLNFCSRELIYSLNSKVAKAYSGNISDIVQKIFSDESFLSSKEKLYIDKTSNSLEFIAPYWTPLETINWLSTRSINKDGVSNYLFFETNQSFEYTSVDSLIKLEPKREYVYSDVDYNSVYGMHGDTDSKYNIVESLENGVTFDYMRNLSSGMYSSKLFTYDLTTKNISSVMFDYIDDFDKSKHLNSVPLRSNLLMRKKLASLYFIEKNNYLSGKYIDQKYNSFYLQRNSLLEQLAAFKISIKVPGRTDIKVGQTVTFTVPEMRQILKDEIDDTSGKSDYFSGKYLITAIRHQILSGKHTMYMELVSDSFSKQLVTK